MGLLGSKTTADYLAWDTMLLLVQKLERDKNYRFALLIGIGSHIGLRIGDLLQLKWGDILHNDKIVLIEKKTSKERTLHLHKDAIELTKRIHRVAENDPEELIFIGRFGNPLSSQYINRELKRIAIDYGLNIRYSTHSLRKTFGRRIYNKNQHSEHALVLLGEVFNHSSTAITKRYLGIKEEEIRDIYLTL